MYKNAPHDRGVLSWWIITAGMAVKYQQIFTINVSDSQTDEETFQMIAMFCLVVQELNYSGLEYLVISFICTHERAEFSLCRKTDVVWEKKTNTIWQINPESQSFSEAHTVQKYQAVPRLQSHRAEREIDFSAGLVSGVVVGGVRGGGGGGSQRQGGMTRRFSVPTELRLSFP